MWHPTAGRRSAARSSPRVIRQRRNARKPEPARQPAELTTLAALLPYARVAREGRRASTSVKDPIYPDTTRYITDPIAAGVVTPCPLRAVADHGRIPEDSVRGQYADAGQVLSDLEALGVDSDHATDGLERHPTARPLVDAVRGTTSVLP